MRLHAPIRALAVLGFVLASTAHGAGPFRILRVTPERVEPRTDTWAQVSSSSNVSLEKFQQVASQVPEQEEAQEFTVVWRYTGRERVDRVDVTFDFRQENVAEKRAMKLSYRTVGPGSAESVFRVGGDALRKDGSVEAWKVSLAVDGEVVASRASWSWDR
jgi:hypothetical protein